MKILVRMTNWVGDCLIASPAIRKLRDLYPDAEIDLLVKKNISTLFENNPFINRVHTIESKQSLKNYIDLVKRIKNEKYDRVYIFPRSWNSALPFYFAQIPERIGYHNQGRGLVLTKGFKRNQSELKTHQAQYYWNLVAGSEPMPDSEKRADLLLDPSVEIWAKELFKEKFNKKKVIGIAPGATYGSAKMWLPERFERLCHYLQKDPFLEIVFFGGPSEAEWVNKMTDRIPGTVSFAGKTNLQELAALMKNCDLVLTNDSGPMHVAAAVSVPLVVLFGPTNYENTAPLSRHKLVHKRVSCSPCLLRHCPIDHRCMKQIEVDEVYNAVLEYLEETG